MKICVVSHHFFLQLKVVYVKSINFIFCTHDRGRKRKGDVLVVKTLPDNSGISYFKRITKRA